MMQTYREVEIEYFTYFQCLKEIRSTKTLIYQNENATVHNLKVICKFFGSKKKMISRWSNI